MKDKHKHTEQKLIQNINTIILYKLLVLHVVNHCYNSPSELIISVIVVKVSLTASLAFFAFWSAPVDSMTAWFNNKEKKM